MKIYIKLVLMALIAVPLVAMENDEERELREAIERSMATHAQEEASRREQEEFEKKFGDYLLLKKAAADLEAQGNQDVAYEVIKFATTLSNELNQELILRSSNVWFLTGNSLTKKLRLEGIQTIETEKGLCVQNNIKTKNPLYQLVSHHQIYNSCGFNSFANACALEQQQREGLAITTDTTRLYAQLCLLRTIGSCLYFQRLRFPEEGIEFATADQLGTAAEVQERYQLNIMPYFLSLNELLAFEDEQVKSPIIQEIRTNPIVHFVVNIGMHWVLVSVVKEGDGYTLYHLNSSNAPIDQSSALELVIHYIDDLVTRARG